MSPYISDFAEDQVNGNSREMTVEMITGQPALTSEWSEVSGTRKDPRLRHAEFAGEQAILKFPCVRAI
jgi:hypothetical protein